MQHTERRTVECLRCGFRWRPFYNGTPQKCANCSSTLWNTPRKIKWSKPAKRHPMAGPILCALLSLGLLLRSVQTDMGTMEVYRSDAGCTLAIGDEVVQVVPIEVCES